MLGVRNIRMSNIVFEHYGSVSFHDGMANIVPQFFMAIDHDTHGTTTTTIY
jgi:hypothetical protein